MNGRRGREGKRPDAGATAQHLGESEALRRDVLESLPDFIVMVDRARRFVWVNRVAPTLSRQEVIGRLVDEFVAPEHHATMRGAIASVFATGQDTWYEAEAYGDGQQSAWYLSRVVPVRGATGAVEHVLLISSDVTKTKQAELALRASEARFRALAEQSPDLIVVVNAERAMEYINRALAGHARDSLIGRRLDEFIAEPDRARAAGAIDEAFATGTTREYEGRGADDPALCRVRVSRFETNDGHPRVLVVATDITRQRADEEAREAMHAQLQQAQRLESIGLLAGGIAHDFNNLLQVIQSNLHFIQRRLDEPRLKDDIAAAILATDRAAELTAHLLAIGRRRQVDPRRIDLFEFVERTVRMLRRTIPENIRIDLVPPEAPAFVAVDPPQLEQVLINLCVNARDAMPAGGTLTIGVRIAREAPAQAVLRVADSGSGIAEHDLKRVFEPFFTTKGTGSGLGLAVVAGIVAAHGGTIAASSDPGAGTVFEVRLPLVAAPAAAAVKPERATVGGHETILVAEDEPLVRTQVKRVLTEAGYRVVEAEDGHQAVARFCERTSDIALALLDVMMPGRDGWEAFLAMEAIRPGVKVLFTTGYSANVLPADFARRGRRLLAKPYKPDALLKAVREMLDER